MKLGFFATADNVKASPFGAMSVIKSIAVSYGFTFAVFAVFAVLLTYTSVPDTIIDTVVLLTMIFAVMISGFTTARRATSRGWLNGAVGGLIYVLILYIVGAMFVTGLVFDKNVVILMLIGFLSGAFGGIVGINMKKK